MFQPTVGKAEAFIGKRTDDEERAYQGQKDQEMGEARQNIEKAKDDKKY